MVLLAGPNGAGKSTLYEMKIAPRFSVPFINADVIQRDELRDLSPEAAYKAAEIAASRRDARLAEAGSFATETVFSHPSKLDLIRRAKEAGFAVFLYHVGVESADLSVERVAARMREGGHAVPERKVRERFHRNGPIIRDAMRLCDRTNVFDNSRFNVPPERIIAFAAGGPVFVKPVLPAWALTIYGGDLTI